MLEKPPRSPSQNELPESVEPQNGNVRIPGSPQGAILGAQRHAVDGPTGAGRVTTLLTSA